MQSDSENCLSFLIFWGAQFFNASCKWKGGIPSLSRAEFETEVDICKNRQLINRPKSNLTGVQITIAEAVSSANWIRKLVKLSESRESFFALAQFKKTQSQESLDNLRKDISRKLMDVPCTFLPGIRMINDTVWSVSTMAEKKPVTYNTGMQFCWEEDQDWPTFEVKFNQDCQFRFIHSQYRKTR